MYKDWNLEALSSRLRHFLSQGVNSRIATLANPQFTFKDIGLIEPREAIRCSPTGQSKAMLCKLQTLVSKHLTKFIQLWLYLFYYGLQCCNWKAVRTPHPQATHRYVTLQL